MDDAPGASQAHTQEQTSPVFWAAYLACSWTWCIGMFLPALLVRDYGWPAVAVFLAPNALGAAAMGWVLASRESSRSLVERHEAAMVLFGAVTIAFHVFFLIWALGMSNRIGQAPTWGLVTVAGAAVGVIALMRLFGRSGGPALGGVSWLIWVVSAGVLALLLTRPAFAPATPRYFPLTADTASLLWLAPVCVFGFALCPYLDLTFHKARQDSTSGPLAFGAGFLVLFPVMIVLTLVYAGPFIALLAGDTGAALSWAPWVGVAILVHVVAQLLFTVIAHQHRIAETRLGQSGRVLTIILAAAAVILGLTHDNVPGVGAYSGAEVVYRCFMGCYGLVFPAYVWIVMIPGRNAGEPGFMRRALRVWALSVGIAAPMFWMGFVAGREVWLAPGIGVVLLARLFAR